MGIRSRMFLAGLGLALAVGGWRCSPTGRVLDLTTGETRAGGCLAIEQAIVLPVAGLAGPLGLDPTGETHGVAWELAWGVPSLRRLPSVWMDSLGSRRVALESPATGSAPTAAVVFLHGYGGAFTWPCAAIAQAARAVGATTLCPALSPEGRWGSPAGRARLRDTLELVESRGIEQVFLVGLSNGAVGAATLAPEVRPEIDGLVLISGGVAPDVELPVLVLQGSQDRMAGTPPKLRRRGLQQVTLSTDHFLLLRHQELATTVLADWLARQLATVSP